MRRIVLIGLALAALAAPAAAMGVRKSPGDGTLVVRSGSAPDRIASVTLIIKGTVVGHVSTGSPDVFDKIVVDDLNGTTVFNATSVGNSDLSQKKTSATETSWLGTDFRFRGVGDNYYKITIYGSGVNLFAVGQGKVTLQGMPDSTVKDGLYSINGADFKSLPTAPSPWLQISSPSG
jgi:hypothetical protein